MRPVLEVADIFRRHGPAYRHAHADQLSGTERRVMAAIEACRTPVLGGHVEHCADCGLVRCFRLSTAPRNRLTSSGLMTTGSVCGLRQDGMASSRFQSRLRVTL